MELVLEFYLLSLGVIGEEKSGFEDTGGGGLGVKRG